MLKYALAVIAVLAVSCTLFALMSDPPADESAPPAPPPAEQVFAGKVLVIHLKSDPETTLTIEEPVISRVGNRAFLVGTCVDDGETEDEWRDGLTVWTALDDIAQIVEVHDRDELNKRMQDSSGDDVTMPKQA